MTILRFTVPMRPVSVNRLYVRTPQGVHKTAEARLFSNTCATAGLQARKKARWGTYEGEVDVLIGVRGRCDLAAPEKIAVDALQVTNLKQRRLGAGIIQDDKQVRAELLVRLQDGEPRLEMAVAPAGELFDLSDILPKGG